jgi:YD repeat-containing protein
VGTGPSALVTTYKYHEVPADTSNYGRLFEMQESGGRWERYYYDSIGRVIRNVKQRDDNPLPNDTAQENANNVTLFGFGYFNGSYIENITNNVGSVTVSIEENSSYEFTTAAPEFNRFRRTRTDRTVRGQKSTETRVERLSGPFAGMPDESENFDGSEEIYDYSILPGGSMRLTVAQEGAYAYLHVNGVYGIWEGTETRTITDIHGNPVSEFVYSVTTDDNDVVSKVLISKTLYETPDSIGRPRTVRTLGSSSGILEGPDGSDLLATTTFSCCGIESRTGADGVTVSYEYDDLGRRISEARLGIVTGFEHDAAGRIIRTTRKPFGQPAVELSATDYDDAGRVIESRGPVIAAGLSRVTTHAYDVAGNTTTTVYPDGGTRVEAQFQDGRPKRVTGSSVRPVQFTYSVNAASGLFNTTTLLDANGDPTPEFQTEFVDSLGKTWRVERPYMGANGIPQLATRESTFNTKGQLLLTKDEDGYWNRNYYNARGELEVTALDTDPGAYDLIDEDEPHYWGMHRIQETVREVATQTEDGQNHRVHRSTTRVWDQDNVDAGRIVSVSDVSVDGLRRWETIGTGADAATSKSVTTINPTTATRTETATAPGGSSTVSTYVQGRLQSVSVRDAQGWRSGAPRMVMMPMDAPRR